MGDVGAQVRLMTTREVAERLNVAPGTVERWRFERSGPRWYRLGGVVRYDRGDVERWIARGRSDD